MQAFEIKNISKTVAMTVWANSAHHAGSIAYRLIGDKRSTLRIKQINGRPNKFNIYHGTFAKLGAA